ncbi:MAG TPA: hypothetical protein VF177_05360 [Anaerolineae bacterium]
MNDKRPVTLRTNGAAKRTGDNGFALRAPIPVSDPRGDYTTTQA